MIQSRWLSGTSNVAQRKRAGLITRRTLDRNEALLSVLHFICSIFIGIFCLLRLPMLHSHDRIGYTELANVCNLDPMTPRLPQDALAGGRKHLQP